MENEQAGQAVHNYEAASAQEAGNQRERTMSSLLAKMKEPQEEELSASEEQEQAALELEEPFATKVTEATAAAATGAMPTDEQAEEQANADEHEDDGGDREGGQGEAKAKNFRGRWDHLDEEERRVVELTAKRGLSLSEAYRAVYGVNAQGEAASGSKSTAGSEAETAGHALQEVEAEIVASEERLQRLKEERTGARGDMEAYDHAVEAYLGERERLQELRLRQRAMQSEAVERAERTRREAHQQAQEALAAEFPEALVPGTELHEACQEELAYLQEIGSPLKDDPAATYKVARRLARWIGRRSGEGATAALATSDATAPKRTMRPLPAGGVPVETPLAALERRISGAHSSGAMLDLMREYGTPIEALMGR